MKRHSHFFLILCWLAYFAVPLVNGIGQTGEQRIEICTTLGVESYYAFHGDTADSDKAKQHSSSHSCPCTHLFMDTAVRSMAFLARTKAFDHAIVPTTEVIATPQRTVHARAPPALLTFSEDQKLA